MTSTELVQTERQRVARMALDATRTGSQTEKWLRDWRDSLALSIANRIALTSPTISIAALPDEDRRTVEMFAASYRGAKLLCEDIAGADDEQVGSFLRRVVAGDA